RPLANDQQTKAVCVFHLANTGESWRRSAN
ncbi:hypothetical protein A2U01_0118356, partial [Trifolium medium]|nr:hypothetical protein [Trifolium medium]